MTVRTSSIIGAVALVLGLSACGKKSADKDIAGMDRELVGNATEDPALTGALQDQIVVNPKLAGGKKDQGASPAGKAAPGAPVVATKGTLRAPAPTPAATSGKGTLGELAKVQAGVARARAKTKGCDMNVRYNAAWASRLPVSIPLYPGARVSEAAGNDTPNCRLRVVSFSSSAPMQTLIDWYYTTAIRAGYSSEHQAKDGEHILAGARKSDDGAYYIFFNKGAAGGTDIDLIVNNGR